MRRLALDTMNVPAVQAWLEDYAARGWYLESYGFYLAKFVRGEPRENVRYRLQPTGPQAGLPDPDIQEAYREMGWSYVCSSFNGRYSCGPRTEFHIWRCDDPDTPELDTDQSLREEGYGELLRRSRRNISLGALLLAVTLATIWWIVWDRPQQFLLEDYYYYSSSIFLLCWNIVLILYLVSGSLRLIRFTRRLRQEEPAPQRAPWGWARARAWGLWAAYVLLLLLIFGGLSHRDAPRPYLPVSQYEEAVPYVPLSELGTPAAGEAEAVDFHSVWGKSVWWTAEGDSDAPPYCHTEYYGLRFSSMAENLEEQLLRQQWQFFEDEDHPRRQIAVLGTDSAWYQRDGRQGERQRLLLRRGGQVLYVFYRGEADLLGHADKYVELLERFG